MEILIFTFGTVVTLIVGGALAAGIVANNREVEAKVMREAAVARRRTG